MLRIAGGAIDRLVVAGLEGHLGGLAALCANGIEHLAFTAIVVSGLLGLTGFSALGAAGGLILETLLRVELLLTGGESELSAAILANQRLVFEHD